MIFEVPIDITTTTADGEVVFAVELDGLTYNMRLSFCEQSQLWYMDLNLQVGTTATPIALGLAMVTAMPLLAGVQVTDRPAGELIIDGAVDAGRNDLGSTCKLMYYDADEMTRVFAS